MFFILISFVIGFLHFLCIFLFNQNNVINNIIRIFNFLIFFKLGRNEFRTGSTYITSFTWSLAQENVQFFLFFFNEKKRSAKFF